MFSQHGEQVLTMIKFILPIANIGFVMIFYFLYFCFPLFNFFYFKTEILKYFNVYNILDGLEDKQIKHYLIISHI